MKLNYMQIALGNQKVNNAQLELLRSALSFPINDIQTVSHIKETVIPYIKNLISESTDLEQYQEPGNNDYTTEKNELNAILRACEHRLTKVAA